MPKVFTYRGHTIESLQKLPMDEFIQLLPARQRRSVSRGFPPEQRKLIERIRKAKTLASKGKKLKIQTHRRDMVVLPEMVGLTIGVHDGRVFVPIRITPEHIGHFLGEFAITSKRVVHGDPGIGATRSSQFVPLK